MPGIVNITVEATRISKDLADMLVTDQTLPNEACTRLANYFAAIAGGTENVKVIVYIEDDDGTAASQTIACTQANADAGDTVTVSGVVFTVAASPSSDPSDGEFAAGASDTAMGDNLEAAINAHPKLTGLVTASNTTGTVTLTAGTDGVWGNQIPLVTSDATAFALGAARFASGAVGTTNTAPRAYLRGNV